MTLLKRIIKMAGENVTFSIGTETSRVQSNFTNLYDETIITFPQAVLQCPQTLPPCEGVGIKLYLFPRSAALICCSTVLFLVH